MHMGNNTIKEFNVMATIQHVETFDHLNPVSQISEKCVRIESLVPAEHASWIRTATCVHEGFKKSSTFDSADKIPAFTITPANVFVEGFSTKINLSNDGHTPLKGSLNFLATTYNSLQAWR